MIYIAGFYGWSDAGRVSTETIKYILHKLESKFTREIKGYNILTITRPYFLIEGGLVRDFKEPSTSFFLCEKEELVISLGFEPDLKWSEYVNEVFSILEAYKVDKIFTIGSMFDRVSHRKGQRISMVTNKEPLKEEINVGFITYHGPGSIHSFLIYESKKRNLEATTFWFSVPMYLPHVVYYPAIHSAVEFLSKKIDFSINVDEIERKAKNQLDELAREAEVDPNFKKLLEEIEGEGIVIQ
jgi:predicted ATP-grasp superfamily ATP-dependent carboligase